MNLYSAMQHFRGVAKDTGHSIDEVFNIIEAHKKREKEIEDERRTTPEEKLHIKESLGALNGKLSKNLPIQDFLTENKIAISKRTVSYAKREVKRLLLLQDQRANKEEKDKN